MARRIWQLEPGHRTAPIEVIAHRARGLQPGRYSLLLTSVAAELMWALAEGVTNPGHAAHILSHLRAPSGEYPDEFQIVIQARFHSNVPVEIRYVAHRALFKSS